MAYIGTWPATVGFRTVNFKALSQTKQTTSQSGRRVRISTAGTRFSATIQYPRMSLTNWKPIQAVATRLNGPLNSFDIVLPSVSENTSGAVGLTMTSSALGAGSNSIAVSTNLNNTTVFKAGDVVRFASHTKVYMLTADVTTDGTGNASLSITPNLIEATTAAAVTFDAVPFRMTLANDIQEYKYATDGTIAYEIDIIEEL